MCARYLIGLAATALCFVVSVFDAYCDDSEMPGMLVLAPMKGYVAIVKENVFPVHTTSSGINEKDSIGRRNHYTYDTDGKLTEKVRYLAPGLCHTTRYEYNNEGLCESETGYIGEDSPGSLFLYSYSGQGHHAGVEYYYAGDVVWSYEIGCDPYGRVTDIRIADSRGNELQNYGIGYTDGMQCRKMTYSDNPWIAYIAIYDRDGNPVCDYSIDYRSGTVSGKRSWSYSYDNVGNWITRTGMKHNGEDPECFEIAEREITYR